MRIFNSIATETKNENEIIVSIEVVTNEYSQVVETPSTFTREDGTVENFIEYEYLDSNIIGAHMFNLLIKYKKGAQGPFSLLYYFAFGGFSI